jgi:hypothetical protein
MGEDVEMPKLWVRRGIGLGGAGQIVRAMDGLQTPSSTGLVSSTRLVNGHGLMWGDLFHSALNPETFFDAGYVRDLMGTAAGSGSWSGLAGLSEGRTEEFGGLLDSGVGDDGGPVRRALLVQSIPMAAVFGSSLQGLIAPGVFEGVGHLRLMAVLADDIGVAAPGSACYDAFWQLLRQESLTECADDAYEFVSLRGIEEEMFALPAVSLAMSRRSDEFLFEVIGIDSVRRNVGILLAWRALRAQGSSSTEWVRLDLAAVSAEVADRCRSLKDAIDTHMRDRDVRTVLEPLEVEWQRVRVGYKSLSPLPVKRGALALLRSARRSTRTGRSLLTSPLMHHSQIGAVS